MRPVLAMFGSASTPAASSRSRNSAVLGVSTSAWSRICCRTNLVGTRSRRRASWTCPVVKFRRSRCNSGSNCVVSARPCSTSSSPVACMTWCASHFPCHNSPPTLIRDTTRWTCSYSVSMCRTKRYGWRSGSSPTFRINPAATSCHAASVRRSPAGSDSEQCHTGRRTPGRSRRLSPNSAAISRGDLPERLPPMTAAPARMVRRPLASSVVSR